LEGFQPIDRKRFSCQEDTAMHLDIRQSCLNTTFVGVLKGVADYFGIQVDAATLFGGTGHAFMINIHEALCPSGPYCWNTGYSFELLRNFGIRATDHGFFSAASEPETRRRIETTLVDRLQAGLPCALLNMENQLITGFDDTGLLTAQPWPGHDFPPAHLSFGSWEELGPEIHLNFYSFEQQGKYVPEKAAYAGLQFAVDLHDDPARFTEAPYSAGPRAYDTWIRAVEAGHGASHGHWWNATVWSESRLHAADFVFQLAAADKMPVLEELAAVCRQTGDLLREASDKALDAGRKIKLLRQAQQSDQQSVELIRAILAQRQPATAA